MNGFLKYEGIGEVVFLIERQFHVLVHFRQIDEDYRKELIESGYSIAAIENKFGNTTYF